MEQKQARNIYLWLWLSPILTIPTLIMISVVFSNLRLPRPFCLHSVNPYLTCIENMSLLLGVLFSGMWHFVLLLYIFPRRHLFVRGHAAQGLILAGIRTLLAVIAVLNSFESDYSSIGFALSLMLLVWLFGNIISMSQVRDGRCTLLNLRGITFTLTPLPPNESEIRQRVYILRYSTNPRKRANAIETLNQLGMVEHTQPVETFD